jgi:cobalt transporter subunit CbtB
MSLNISVIDSFVSPSLADVKNKVLPSLLAAALGAVLIYGAGFSEMSQLHNAAHDGRHSAGFPCH